MQMEFVRRPKTFAALILALAIGFSAAFAGSAAFGGSEGDLPVVDSSRDVRIAEVPGTAGLPSLSAPAVKPKAAKPKAKKNKRKAAKRKVPTTTVKPPVITKPPVVTRPPVYQPPVSKPRPRATAAPVDEFEEF